MVVLNLHILKSMDVTILEHLDLRLLENLARMYICPRLNLVKCYLL